MKCWATIIGGCTRSSKEHLISQSTFRNDTDYKPGVIKGYGFPWSENKIVEIPFASLSAKVLCSHHNNALSNLDNEAGMVAKTFLEVKNIFSKKSPRSNEEVVIFHHSGDLLQRWFLKTFINFQSLYNKSALPPKELVEIVFGLRKYPDGVGLAVLGHMGGYHHSFDHDMKYVQILNDSNEIEFMIFEYFGISYLLPLTDQAMPKKVMNLNHSLRGYSPIDQYISRVQGAPVLAHPKGINFKFGNRQRIEITFFWG